jgi:glutamine---fructose-6-phosphate transaminase (isomerizing)
VVESGQPVTLLLENILHQPAALGGVARYHDGEGREALERAAALLKRSKRVIVSGMGASFYASLGFAYVLNSSGFRAQSIEASELLYFLDSQVGEETTLILVSRSGESVEITKLLKKIHGRAAAVIGLSNIAESTLSRGVSQAIIVASPPDEFVAIQTYTATVAAFALLHAALKNDLDKAVQELLETSEILASWIPDCVQSRQYWDVFLTLRGPCYVLARGPGLGSVAEGVLLMHETAKSPAVGMSTAQFRHGPVEAVDADFHVVVLGTQAQTADLDAALANDITAMKGTVRWLGPRVSTCRAPLLCPWPENTPSRFQAVAEIIPLQCLAYRKAELMGIAPGKFRWAPLVTTSESGFAIPQTGQTAARTRE